MLDDQVLSRITGTVYRGGIERISTREILQVLGCSERETKLGSGRRALTERSSLLSPKT